jgi:hypothetical protein
MLRSSSCDRTTRIKLANSSSDSFNRARNRRRVSSNSACRATANRRDTVDLSTPCNAPICPSPTPSRKCSRRICRCSTSSAATAAANAALKSSL